MPNQSHMNATRHGGYHAHTSRPTFRGGYLPALSLESDPGLPTCVLDPYGRALNGPCIVDTSTIPTVVPMHAYLGRYPQGAQSVPSPVQSIGGLFQTVSTDDVHNAKIAVDPQFVATGDQWNSVALGSAANNPSYSLAAANDYPAWTAFKNTWDAFVLEDSTYFGASDDIARINDFVTELKEWQTRLTADTAGLSGGGLTPILAAQAPSLPVHGDALGIEGTLTRVATIAGIVLLGVLTIEVLPVLLPFHAHSRARSRA